MPLRVLLYELHVFVAHLQDGIIYQQLFPVTYVTGQHAVTLSLGVGCAS